MDVRTRVRKEKIIVNDARTPEPRLKIWGYVMVTGVRDLPRTRGRRLTLFLAGSYISIYYKCS